MRNGYRLMCGVLAMLFVLSCVTACGKAEQSGSTARTPGYDAQGNYTGFSDIAGDSTVEKALARGCYVVDGGQLAGGKEQWEAFLEAAEAGNDAFLRVATLIYPKQLDVNSTDNDPAMYYDDLYYYQGKYYCFCYNGADDIRASGPYTYLRELKGMAGNPQKEHTKYVLTDSLELTFQDVEWSFLSSNLETVTKIPFEWLGFTIYMREGK